MEASVAVIAERIKAMEIANDEKPVVVGPADGGDSKNAATAAADDVVVATAATDVVIPTAAADDVFVAAAAADDVFVAAAAAESQTKTKKAKNKNRIHVSSTKRPFLFYCNLAKRYIKQYNAVELSGLGMAIPTVITIAETLKSNGLAVEQKISTSTFESKLDDEDGRFVQKPQIAILLGKAEIIEETPVVAAA